MAMIPWNQKRRGGELATRRSFRDWRDEMDHVFDRFMQVPMGLWNNEGFPGAGWGPTLDVRENDSQIVVEAELPGVDPDDLDINVSANTLTISGEKKEESEGKEDDYVYAERRYGSFRRSLTLPADVDADRVQANFRKGVLTITLPKAQTQPKKKIRINSQE